MKNMKHYLAYCAVFALLLAGCSKDDKSGIENNPDASYVDLSFSALLDDLSNRAMQAGNTKAHFGQVPDCSSEAPATARIQFSYNENTYTTEVDILFDGSTYFTDYTEDLKIPVANGGTTTVTLEEFQVFDGGGNLIWIAPISSEAGQFDGYVDKPLPFDIVVRDGTKPYIDVEVLCFDRRMVNEYGYVFFDIIGKELIEFCVFGNFCPPSGRHYVASYSLNVWIYENGQATDQLYSNLTREVVENSAGEWSADPLCIVLPDDPNSDDQYLIEITILDGPQYDAQSEVIRRTVLSDQEVRTFFDGDDNLEYFHFFEGCGENDNPPIFDDPRDDKMTYKTCLKGIDNSGAIALAAVSIQGTAMDVTILATGMQDGMSHPQHIHGPSAGNDDATCDDYGSPIFPLELSGGGFPGTDGNGNYIYNRSFTLTNNQLSAVSPLDKTVVVLHGVTGNPGKPVACGELEKINP